MEACDLRIDLSTKVIVSTIAGQTPGMLSEPQTQSVPPPFETFACEVKMHTRQC